MIFTHQYGNIAIEAGSTVEIGFDVTNDIASGDSVSSVSVVAVDENGTTVTATIISSSSTSGNVAYAVIASVTAGTTYEVEFEITTTNGRLLTRRITVDGIGSADLNPKLGDSGANTYVNLKEANDYIRNNFYHPDQWDNLTFEGRKRVLVQAAKDIDAMNYKDKPYYSSQKLVFPRSTHETYEGVASINTATTGKIRGLNLYDSTYNDIPDNYFRYGTVHIDSGNNFRQTRYISSSTASKAGGYGEVVVSSPFDSNVVASDHYIIFTPLPQEIKDAQCEQAMHIIANEFYKYADYVHAGIGYVRTGDLGVSFKDSNKSLPGNKICFKSRRLLGRWLRKSIKVGRA
jgi:hypothetical protein